jgi:class 3 adenylate cyclase
MQPNNNSLKSGPVYSGLSLEDVDEQEMSSLIDIRKIRKDYQIKQFFGSSLYILAVIVSSLYALFVDDFRHLIVPKSLDFGFNILTLIVFGFFVADIALLSVIKNGYIFRVAFWLDVTCSLFLLLDVSWVTIPVIKSRQVSIYGKLARGARAAQIGVQLGKLWRVWRDFRAEKKSKEPLGLSRSITSLRNLSKQNQAKKIAIDNYYSNPKFDSLIANELYPSDQLKPNEITKDYLTKKKFLVRNHGNSEEESMINKPKPNPHQAHHSTKVSNLGKILATKNIERAITIIILLTVCIPLFREDTFRISFKSYQSGQDALSRLIKNRSYPFTPEIEDALNAFVKTFSVTQRQILYLQVFQREPNQGNDKALMTIQVDNSKSIRQITQLYRGYELFNITSPEDKDDLKTGDMYIVSVFQSRFFESRNAVLNIFRTLLILFLIVWFSMLMHRDATALIIEPFEEMMIKISKLEENPILTWKEDPEILKDQAHFKALSKKQQLKEREKDDLETSILLNTLVQSGKLLALGFGEAGSDIITNFLSPVYDKNFKRVYCLYGFCEIRKFSEATELLHDEIIAFVNHCADIVSTIVDYHLGSTNKNIGEVFLLIWKFDEYESIVFQEAENEPYSDHEQGAMRYYSDQNTPVAMKCELALISFLEIMLHVGNHQTIGYKCSADILTLKLSQIRPSLGFGLHIGWSIEGAIGSNHKIDASYLSPNVNLASRLMAATKQYNVSMLISGEVVDRMSDEVRLLLRHVDTVHLKGSKVATKLYTFDMYFEDGGTPTFKKYFNKILKNKQMKGFEDYKKERQNFHNQLINKRISSRNLLLSNAEVANRHSKFGAIFDNTWQIGMEKYLEGDWEQAKAAFERTRDMVSGHIDGPSQNLIAYIDEHNEVAPIEWKGVRKLYSK